MGNSQPSFPSLPAQLRGITPTMVREGIYTASYLGLAPVIRQALRESGHSDTVAFVGSASASGLTAGTLTHPFDTAKTRMQSNIDGSNPAYRTTFSTLGTLMSEVRHAIGFYDQSSPSGRNSAFRTRCS